MVGGGHEAEELVHVAHREPIRVDLHGRLHLLGTQEVPHHLGHAPPARPAGGERRVPLCPPCASVLQALPEPRPGLHQPSEQASSVPTSRPISSCFQGLSILSTTREPVPPSPRGTLPCPQNSQTRALPLPKRTGDPHLSSRDAERVRSSPRPSAFGSQYNQNLASQPHLLGPAGPLGAHLSLSSYLTPGPPSFSPWTLEMAMTLPLIP